MAATKTTGVTVKPVQTNGSDVECDITGADVIDDAIWLDRTDSYDITFQLVGGGSGNPSEFDHNNPFANRNAKCPKATAKDQSPCAVTVCPTAPKYDSFTVQVSPVSGKGVIHYRINFQGGSSCDPVIIHQ